jgi:PIN domain nuclease of toxin-antitoxin system
MRVLLDTHALLWWTLEEPLLSAKAHDTIANFENEVFVSAASVWEIATKFRLGRLPQAAPLAHSLRGQMRKLAFSELPISFVHAETAGLLPGPHRDPFDRMLIAQALTDGLLLISNESLFDAYNVRRVW